MESERRFTAPASAHADRFGHDCRSRRMKGWRDYGRTEAERGPGSLADLLGPHPSDRPGCHQVGRLSDRPRTDEPTCERPGVHGRDAGDPSAEPTQRVGALGTGPMGAILREDDRCVGEPQARRVSRDAARQGVGRAPRGRGAPANNGTGPGTPQEPSQAGQGQACPRLNSR